MLALIEILANIIDIITSCCDLGDWWKDRKKKNGKKETEETKTMHSAHKEEGEDAFIAKTVKIKGNHAVNGNNSEGSYIVHGRLVVNGRNNDVIMLTEKKFPCIPIEVMGNLAINGNNHDLTVYMENPSWVLNGDNNDIGFQ